MCSAASLVCWIMVCGPSFNSCPRILHLLKRLWSFGYVFPQETARDVHPQFSLEITGRSGAPLCVISCSCQQKALMACCFSLPLQALPMWSLLPVLLPALRAKEPRCHALQRQAFQVWLLWARLRWCHNTQQPHPDTHWGKALQVSTWSQRLLPAEIREGNALLLLTSVTSTRQRFPWKPRSDQELKHLVVLLKSEFIRIWFWVSWKPCTIFHSLMIPWLF